MLNYQERFPISPGEIQFWTAEMWSLLWNLWLHGHKTEITKDLDFSWPNYKTLDTVTVARQLLTKEDVPNCKLSTLATYFGTKTEPTHRALDDARATTEILHGLFEKLGSLEIYTLEALLDFAKTAAHIQRKNYWGLTSI